MSKRHQIIRNHFRLIDPVIHSAMQGLNFDEWIKSYRKKRSTDYFQALCREIIGQQLSGKAADAIYSRFTALFGNGQIEPQQLLSTKDNILRNTGLSWSKVSYIKNIAEAYVGKTVAFDNLHNLADEVIIEELTKIKGVGRWTAKMFLIFTLGRENVFSHADLGLRKGFSKIYSVENPTREYIEEIVAKWSPYKSYGSITLWHVLDKKN